MRDFNHSIGVLVKAYLNNTLLHSNCYACAVGNLIADANNIRFETAKSVMNNDPDLMLKWVGYESAYASNCRVIPADQDFNWISVFSLGKVRMANYCGTAKDMIDATGYTVHELAKIEQAFESVDGYDIPYDEYMFNGLMEVVNILADIHGIDLQARESSKLLFVKS